jgi:GNAT superfamily N-acetyltransferase
MPIERVVLEDLPEIDRLQPSDWKGVAEHYRYYITHDNCVPLKITVDGSIKALGALIYHQDSAWLAHIIVDPAFRGHGTGSTITQSLIDLVDPDFFSSIFLMSTELGYPIYKKLGFEEDAKQFFYLPDKQPIVSNRHPNITTIQAEDYPRVFELDYLAYGESRTYRLLQNIETSLVFKNAGLVQGFYMPNLLEGPIVSVLPEAGKALMLERMKQQSIAIIPDTNLEAAGILETCNWKVFRSARRMRLGARRAWNPQLIYNRFSGQIG